MDLNKQTNKTHPLFFCVIIEKEISPIPFFSLQKSTTMELHTSSPSVSSSLPQQQMVVIGGGTAHQKHQLYLKKRERAYLLETEIEDAQREYIRKMVDMLKVMQKQFYSKYGEKIKDLEDIEESINFVQTQGLKELRRKLQTLYLESLDCDNQEEFKTKSKKLRDDFEKLYFPKDNYQEKRDREAFALKKAILGSHGAVQFLMNNSISPHQEVDDAPEQSSFSEDDEQADDER